MIDSLRKAGLYSFDTVERPIMFSILNNVEASDGNFPGKEIISQDVSSALTVFNEETESIIRSAVERNEIVLQGPVELGFVNIYNARYHEGYLTSTYFLMYREGEENKMIQGDFVIRMKDEKTIDAVYRMGEELK